MDVSTVAHELVSWWLTCEKNNWPNVLNDVKFLEIRERWLRASQLHLDGNSPSPDYWTAIRSDAIELISERDPYRQEHDEIASLIASLSPPPHTSDSSGWATAMLVHASFSRARLIEISFGWSAEDRAKPLQRHQWLRQRVPRDTNGNLDHDLLKKYRTSWKKDNTSFSEKEKHLLSNYSTALAPFSASVKASLAEILRNLRT
ncbi:MAG: hypothetical protein V4764_11685 [Burkholderia sp.]